MSNETFKGDLSKLGYIDIKGLIDLLTAYNENKISNLAKNYIGNDGLNFYFNPNSGCVYLVDNDYNCFMLNNGILDLWVTTPYYGYEGFIYDLINYKLEDIISEDNKEDIEYLSDMLQHTNDNKLIETFNKKLLENNLCDYVLNISI